MSGKFECPSPPNRRWNIRHVPIPAAFRRNALSVTSDKRNKVKRSLR